MKNPVSHLCQWVHYIDVIMTTVASQITSLTVVYSIFYSGAAQRKHQSSASLAFEGEFTGTGEFPAQRTSNAENGSIWWRHHELVVFRQTKSYFSPSRHWNRQIYQTSYTLQPKFWLSLHAKYLRWRNVFSPIIPKMYALRKGIFDDLKVLGNIRNGNDFKTFLQLWIMGLGTSKLSTKFANLSHTVSWQSWYFIYNMGMVGLFWFSPNAHSSISQCSVSFMFQLPFLGTLWV